MISDKYHFIFIHIPKCGGTSVEKSLLDLEGVHCDWTHTFPLTTLSDINQSKYILSRRSQQHQPLNNFRKDLQESYFTFTFCRNPWSRALSTYLYHKKLNTINKSLSLKQFILNQTASPYHLNLQISFINKNIDFIGRFEQLQEDFNIVCDELNIDRRTLPHANKSMSTNYQDYYDNETRKIIGEKYAKDIEYFGYEFGK
jgi:hypothetical protein